MISPAQNNLVEASLIPARVSNDISVAVAAKSLANDRQQGAQLTQLIDAAGQIASPAGDPLVARATGVGGLLDVNA